MFKSMQCKTVMNVEKKLSWLSQRPRIASYYLKLECGSMPNALAALPNIGGALCSTPQSLADAH